MRKTNVGAGALLRRGGRAGRAEFWLIFVAYVFVVLAAPAVMFATYDPEQNVLLHRICKVFAPQAAMFYLVVAAGCRRLHDTGRSGWWQALPIGAMAAALLFASTRDTQDAGLLAFLPCSGFAMLLLGFVYAQGGDVAANAYGPATASLQAA